VDRSACARACPGGESGAVNFRCNIGTFDRCHEAALEIDDESNVDVVVLEKYPNLVHSGLKP
jgi:hypothetical protein